MTLIFCGNCFIILSMKNIIIIQNNTKENEYIWMRHGDGKEWPSLQKKSCRKVIFIDLIWFFLLGTYILLESRTLRLPIPCMETWRSLAECHPFKLTQKGRNIHSNTHSIPSPLILSFWISAIIIFSFLFYLDISL